ncbi:hypothetical protein AXG93_1511s1010 [Marchantia polymorpha subsp. ruderalis]|uniref:Uncharacterized protein n=1 Tax=Marchantia polymorpha subsp. ruderalis TaxID=1480154 RepID=A0A176W2I6_MARPO|nr:hypothetical protein AXG93_1511s1010 [Marchantia polymorpha subsp. ruderalis]
MLDEKAGRVVLGAHRDTPGDGDDETHWVTVTVPNERSSIVTHMFPKIESLQGDFGPHRDEEDAVLVPELDMYLTPLFT